MEFQYEGFGLGQRVKEVSNNWIPLNPDVYLINKPTVLVAGGSGTEGVRGANGNAKVVQSLLDYTGTKANLLSIYYNGKSPSPGMFEYYSRRFTRDLFTPLVCRNNQKLSVDEACKNMRNLTIFAHSLGGKTVENIIAELQEILKKYDYSDQDINKITKQIFVISYGVTMVSPNVNHLSIISPLDEQFASSGETYWKMMVMKILRSQMLTPTERQNLLPEDIVNISEKDVKILSKINFILDSPKLMREFYNQNERCYVMQEGDNELHLVTSPLRISHRDHPITQFVRSKDGSSNINATKAGDCVSRCMASALQYSVNNSILNEQTHDFIPFDISQLRENLENITRVLNEQNLNNKKERTI